MGSRQRAGILVLLLVPILATVLQVRAPLVFGKDGARHFAYVPSLLFDRDLDFSNELEATYPKYAATPLVVEETGMAPNEAAIGAPLLWIPGYLLVHAGMKVSSWFGSTEPTGYEMPYVAAAVLTSALLFSMGVFVAYRLARDYLGAENPWLAVALVAGGSHYLYWWLYPHLYAHSAAVGVTALFVVWWIRSFGRTDVMRWAMLGAFGGIVALVRWQNIWLSALAGAVELGFLVLGIRAVGQQEGGPYQGDLKSRLTVAARCGATAAVLGLVFLLPQLITWGALYSTWYVVPQGETMLQLGKPYLVDMLFSPRYGLLGFSPVLYLPVFGLLLGVFRRRRDPLIVLGVVYFVVTIYLNAALTAGSWYGGATFGPRRLDSLFVFMVMGSAISIDIILRWLRRSPQVALATGVAAMLLFTLFMTAAFRQGGINVGMVGAERFPYDASGFVLARTGWLPSLPAGLYYKVHDGMEIAQYSQIVHDDTLSWLDGRLRLAEEGATHLGSGWRIEQGNKTVLMEAKEAHLFLYLMDLGWLYKDIGIRVLYESQGSDGAHFELLVNGETVPVNVTGSAEESWEAFAQLPYEQLRSGINHVTLVKSRRGDMRENGIQVSEVNLVKLSTPAPAVPLE